MISKKQLLLLLTSSIFLSACTAPQTNAPQSPVGVETKEQSLSTSMRELMAMGTNLQCKYAFTDPDTRFETKGTMYISGVKFAQEAEITIPDENSAAGGKMTMISDGTTMYTWNPDKKDSGMKFTVNKDDDGETADENKNVDLDKKIDMKRTPWSVNQAKFSIPTDVKFVDLNEMMQGLQGKTQGLPAGVPTIPKNIPGAPVE